MSITIICVLLASGCRGREAGDGGPPPAEDEPAAEVNAALEAYASGTRQGRQEAIETFREFTEAHVPALRAVIESGDDRYTILAGLPLNYMRDDASFRLLIDALNGETDLDRRLAATALWRRITDQDELADRLESFDKLQPAIVDYLNDVPSAFDLEQGIRLTMVARCSECLPDLREFMEHEDLDVRLLAARAIRAITGEAIEVDLPPERFTAVRIDPSLVSIQQMIEIREGTIQSAAVATTSDTKVHMVASILVGEKDSERCQVVEFDAEGRRRVLFESSLVLTDILLNPLAKPGGDVPWMVALAKPFWWGPTTVALAFDMEGIELWRFELPSQYRDLNAIAWKYGDKGQCAGVVLVCAGRNGALLGLDLSGREAWRAAIDFSSFDLVTHPCVPGRLLHGTGGYGAIRLLDTFGTEIAESPDPLDSPSISEMAFLPLANGDWGIAAERRGENSLPEIACFDKSFGIRWVVKLSRPLAAMNSLVSRCDQAGYLVCVATNSEIMLIDAEGTLRWRKQLWPDVEPEPFQRFGLDTIRGDKARGAGLVVYSRRHAAILTMHTPSTSAATQGS